MMNYESTSLNIPSTMHIGRFKGTYYKFILTHRREHIGVHLMPLLWGNYGNFSNNGIY